MIIDILTNKKNQVKCSFYDSVSPSLTTNDYTFKTIADIPTWKITRSIAYAYMTVIPSSISMLSTIDMLPVYGTFSDYVIETSIDYMNWYELPFKSDTVGNVYKYLETVGGVKYYLDVDTHVRVPETTVNSIYAYTKINKYTGETENLYNKFHFKYIRFTFKSVQGTVNNPFYIKNLSINVDEEIQEERLSTMILSHRNSSFFKATYFEDYPFIADTFKEYLKMLETNSICDCVHYNPVHNSKFSIKAVS